MKLEAPSITTVIDTNDSDSQRKSDMNMPMVLSSLHSLRWHVMAGKTKSLGQRLLTQKSISGVLPGPQTKTGRISMMLFWRVPVSQELSGLYAQTT
jgi:hypothetical protein